MKREAAGRGNTPVAIVGIGCRFPGGVTDPEGFWKLLVEGRDAITEIPADRIDLAHFYDERPATPGRMMTRWGGYLSRIDELDAAFFGIAPVEAECMDPHQRLLLETAWEALEDAGHDIAALEGTNAAVFMGQWTSDFENRLFADPDHVSFPMTLGSGRYGVAARLSYVFGLRGPCLSIDAACSSGLACVHLGVQSLRAGECELVLAGAANLIMQPHIHIAYSQSRMMAPDGRCKFGDATGNGYVRSEGVGVVVLKTLEKAQRDGDRIYAVIRGSAVNNDGRSSGSMGRPSRVGQEELLRQAYSDAGVDPASVGYVEAHGTGTRAGDPVELDSIAKVLGPGRKPGDGAWVGSVKTNIGHTEATAGIAGIVKAALVLRKGRIAPSLHFKQPNPSIAWDQLPVTIPTRIVEWPKGASPRFAGVSAYGIGGTNAHVVLEEAPDTEPPRTGGEDAGGACLLPLSARSVEGLRALAARYADLLSADGAPGLRDVCWSAATRRTALSHRATFTAADSQAMAQALRAYAAGGAAAAEGVAVTPSRVAFVMPGQGAQWTGMARELMAREPVFRAALERCDAAARPWIDWSIVQQLALDPGATEYRLDRIDVIQPVLVALAIAYAELWRSIGVEPEAVVGHSMGEVGAAYLSGAIDLGHAMQVICRRSALMRRGAGQGAMALVELTMEEARARLAGREDKVAVAGNNSPRSSVISGDPGTVKQVLAELERDGVFGRLVKVDVASHSPQMEPHAAELGRELAAIVPQETRVTMYSTVLGRRVEGSELDAGYWARNLRQPVLFGGTVKQMMDDGITTFVELGPHPVLQPSIQQTAQAASREAATVVCGRREEPEASTWLAAVGGLWSAGAPIDWKKLMPGGGRNVELPFYPWQRERLWVAQADNTAGKQGSAPPSARPDEESIGWLLRQVWTDAPIAKPAATPTPGRWLVVSSDAGEGAVLAQALARGGAAAEVASLGELDAALDRARAGDEGDLRGVVVLAGAGADAPFVPVRALQALRKAAWRSKPRVWFVTRGGQPVEPGRVSVDHAALWGTGRVIAEEHPELWGGLVDLHAEGFVKSDAGVVARHLLSADGEEQVAVRGERRLALRLAAPERDAASTPIAWRADASYLITGGLGGVGLQVAKAMATRGARRLILLGRTPLPPRSAWNGTDPKSAAGERVAAIRALESLGVAVHHACVDLGDEEQVGAWLAQYAAEAWPPIRGVVHAAASLDNHLVDEMDAAAFDSVLRTKLRSAEILDRLLPDLDAFVMFSSIVGYLGQTGEANYAAANAGLDALAHDRRARGLPALTIAWGVWTDTGFARGASGERVTSELARQGIRGFAPERGTTLFAWLCSRAEPAVAVMPIDWAVFRSARAGRGLALYQGLLAGRDAGSAADAGGMRERLAAAAPAERRRMLEEVVRESVAKVLKVAPSRLDPRKALGSMGLNSLMAMELRNRLEAALGRSLSATLAWNHPTVAAIVEHLAGDGSAAPAPERKLTQVAPAGELARMAELSDEEALQALRPRAPGGGS